MDENMINEAFGYTPEADTGSDAGTVNVNGDERAAEDVSPYEDGANGDGSDDTAEAAGDSASASDTSDDPETNGGQLDTDGQSAEENARYAAIRRKSEAERDKAIAAAKADAQSYVNDAIASLGIVSPFTGKLVTTKEELEAYKNARAEDFKKTFKEKNNLDDDGYEQFVSQLPEVIAAREAKARADAAAKAADKETANQRITAEVEAISKLDPDIKTIEDVFKSENYGEVLARVKKGIPLSEAYKIVNFDKLTARSAAAEHQRILNAQAGKSHMTPTTKAHGQALAPVPDDVKASYRLFDPDMSDEDIARDYNKRAKSINK